MLTAQGLLERIQQQVGVPWQSQRPDGYADGILAGNPDTEVTGVVTTVSPSLAILQQAVAKRCNAILCRQSPFFSLGEHAPPYYREGAVPPPELLQNDAVCAAKSAYISAHGLVVIRLVDNWDARPADEQLKALAEKLGWAADHRPMPGRLPAYDPRNNLFQLPATSLLHLAEYLEHRLGTPVVRVIGQPDASLSTVALFHGLLLVADVERVRREGKVDVVIAGDAVEWEAAPYVRDLVTAKMAVGMILIGNAVSEEPGCAYMAGWLRSFVTEVPVEWISSGQPFEPVAQRRQG